MLPKLFYATALLLFALFVPATRAVAAPSVTFDPTSVSPAVNTEFQINIRINTETNSTIGSDAVISYPGADLDVTLVANGGFYPEFNWANNSTGRLELHGYTSTTYDSKSGSGTLATVKFKAKKGSGSSTVTFICAGGGNDTNIITVSGQNVVNCSSLNQLAITYVGAGVPTPTPTPLGPTPTPQAPGGNTIPYCASLTSDVTTAVGAPLAVTFSCAGVDPDGYISAAEFTFGDGTKHLVEQNAGSPGSVSTTHTYTTIGALGASCRVRDNNLIFSPVPDVCKKIITIRPRPSGTSTGTTIITTEPTPTPTPQVVAMVSETPEPTPIPIEEPTATVSADQKILLPWWLWGGLGLIGVGTIISFLGRKNTSA